MRNKKKFDSIPPIGEVVICTAYENDFETVITGHHVEDGVTYAVFKLPNGLKEIGSADSFKPKGGDNA